MEIPGAAYLFNLSVVAVTYAAVSALVMLLRQIMGGKLSGFDIYLIGAYVSFGFAIAFDAVLPPLIGLFAVPAAWLWPIASGLAALLLAINLTSVVRKRLKASRDPLSRAVLISYSIHAAVIGLLLLNAVAPQIQGVALFATALTLCLGNMMWAFVRRIASLLGDQSVEDWDPRRG